MIRSRHAAHLLMADLWGNRQKRHSAAATAHAKQAQTPAIKRFLGANNLHYQDFSISSKRISSKLTLLHINTSHPLYNLITMKH